MLSLCKTFHVLAVGLWFGSVAFFTFTPLLILRAFEEESRKPKDTRPLWFPLPSAFEHDAPEGFPKPLRLEQGTRAFGVAVGSVFPVYYALQLGCAIVCLVTALTMPRSGEGRGHVWRIGLCTAALATVGLGWWLEREVHGLRDTREKRTDAVLIAESPTREQIDEARAARAEFGRWHGYSLIQNFATLGLVTVITVLAAHLPGRSAIPGEPARLSGGSEAI
jgi:acyl phosphate:glycerol-3-phosphate acyltransferase